MGKTPREKLLIGAHTSAAGGVHNALLQGKEIGATTIQLFTSNQKQHDRFEIQSNRIKDFWIYLGQHNPIGDFKIAGSQCHAFDQLFFRNGFGPQIGV